MSLTHRTMGEIVKQQFLFKLRSNAAVITALFVMQAVVWGLIIGEVPNSFPGFSMSTFELRWYSITNDKVVMASLLWSLVVGVLMTTPGQRNASFTYVSSPVTENLANFCFFGLAAIIAGVTTVLSGSVLKLVVFMKDGSSIIETGGLIAAPLDFFSRIVVMIIYTLLIMVVVYTCMLFVQMNRLMIVPIVLLVLLSTKSSVFDLLGFEGNIDTLFDFFYKESSFWLFLVKTGVVMAIVSILSFFPSSRIEVKQS
ncbi:Uncharacterised protein [Lysinibacillus sphaericus]|nr:Uncharacterised protein [Lysinibacillus sphaericus]